MSGHSKWATTKHRKAAQDAKRSALFSKLTRNITVAAREGGDPNPENNAGLAAAIAKARYHSMPKDKIDTAIKKAFGGGSEATRFESVIYEGYAPSGVAVVCEALTDNRNRTAADVRAAFSQLGGNLGTTNSVAYQFERKGQLTVDKELAPDEDEFMLTIADAGAEDYEDAETEWVVLTAANELAQVRQALIDQGLEVKGYELVMIPTTPTTVDVNDAKKVMRLIDRLEDLEDLQNVYHSMDMTDEIVEALEESAA